MINYINRLLCRFSYFLLAASILAPLPDDVARTCACRWDSDENKVVLEISEPEKKRTTDAQVCTWRELYMDLEDEGHVEVTINSHDIHRVSAGSDENRALSLILILLCFHVENEFMFEWYCDSSISKWFCAYWMKQGEFYLKPKPNEMFYAWSSPSPNGVKYTAMASIFSNEAAWLKPGANAATNVEIKSLAFNFSVNHLKNTSHSRTERPLKQPDLWKECGGSSTRLKLKKLVWINWFVQTCSQTTDPCGRHVTPSLALGQLLSKEVSPSYWNAI